MRPSNPIAQGGSFAPTAVASHQPIDYRSHQDLAQVPFSWFREFDSLVAALGHWSAGSTRSVIAKLRRELTLEVGKALGTWPFDYDAAKAVIVRWRQESESRREPKWKRLNWEIGHIVLLLFWAYKDARKFFVRDAPRIFHFQFLYSSPDELGDLLWYFGPGVLLHPGARKAFESCTPEELDTVFSRADGRQTYREGRPKRRRTPPPTSRPPGRPLKADPEPETIAKRKYRQRRRERGN